VVFRLENLLPEPLKETDVSASEVWNRSFEFGCGKCICIQAESGKGKTTLIHILYGRRKDFSGKVLLDGETIDKFNSAKWATLRQRSLSIVFQELMLFGELTGWENILLKLRLTKYCGKEHIQEMASRMNSAHLLQKKCGILSFGERQRIAIIRALVQPFDWLLLDEPFSHLDAENLKLAATLIAEECKKRQAGMLVTALGKDSLFPYDQTITV